jgi:hypothetical protein
MGAIERKCIDKRSTAIVLIFYASASHIVKLVHFIFS